ncbi:hypothetical protein BJY01DRAFT_254270 [Aspergillus pseudoustus]|uniref:ABC transmembrane type-1 domain-containing protein n=1 Tax=Aspergillus pseudoustus TaxID=1810923 RepID=A0ABR4IUN4_9EURO
MSLGCLVIYFGMDWATTVVAQTLSKKFRHKTFDSILKQDLRFFDCPENGIGA